MCTGVIVITATIAPCDTAIDASARRARGAAAITPSVWRIGGRRRADAGRQPGDRQRVGSQAHGDVDHRGEEAEPAEQPRPGVPTEPEPHLAGTLRRG